MKSIPVGVFKTKFSDILQQVKEQGKSFIIEYGRSHKKVAMLVPYQAHKPHQKQRKFGYFQHHGACVIQDDFEITDDEFLGHE